MGIKTVLGVKGDHTMVRGVEGPNCNWMMDSLRTWPAGDWVAGR